MKPYRYFVVFALLLALLPMPYGYFQLLRLIVTIASAVAAYEEYVMKRHGWVFTFVIICLLFNPVFIVSFSRATWMLLDTVTAVVFFLSQLKVSPSFNDR